MKIKNKELYKTTVYKFLKIDESDGYFEITDTHYLLLDEIIGAIKKEIPIKRNYSKETGLKILELIHEVLSEMGFRFKEDRVLEIYQKKEINCFVYSFAIYCCFRSL